jgi:DNA repair exonuclease SbcCD ATPase subunit
LWPPQVREYLFVQKETAISRAELDRQKLSQLKAINTDLKELKNDIMREMIHDRDEMMRLKADIEAVQGEVFADLLQVKEVMNSLSAVNQQY